ncbi:MAG TPA: dihydrolipoyl dehydrogenase [Planctomycetia bacterium]|nr:dihydrolipoyl dehydrogenase [Planctomycetia bacterium]
MAEQDLADLDVVVLGGGPGGYAAAFHAADHGMKVTLIDADPEPGGVCLHRGCIPSKALLHVAKVIQEAKEAEHWGLSYGPPKIDLDKLRAFKTSVVAKLTSGAGGLAKARKVRHLRGRGKFTAADRIAVEAIPGLKDSVAAEVTFDKCIVATGSLPFVPPMFRIDDPRVMDSTGALELPDVPKSLLVIGGGYIGLEMGSVYAALGSKVTVVEMTDGLLPGADRELVRPLQKRLEGYFEKILLNTKVAGLEATPKGIVAKLENAEGATTVTFDRVLVSIGRKANAQNIGLEKTKVAVDEKGFIKVKRNMQSDDPNIYAIGDVAGEPMLAHKAAREAKIAVEAIAGEPSVFDNVAIPAVVFTDPELAWCGLTKTQAEKSGANVKVLRFPWAASGRAQTIGRTEGLTQLIVDAETERILGMGIVGSGAGELIAEGVLAVETACVAQDLADTIHAHPTLSETIMESAEMAFGEATHYYRNLVKK